MISYKEVSPFLPYIDSITHSFFRKGEAGIKSHALGVAVENLHAIGLGALARVRSSFEHFFGDQECPTSTVEKYHQWVQRCRLTRRNALYEISKTRRYIFTEIFSVVLGRPGSGFSTLLKALANQLEEFYSVESNAYFDSPNRKHYRDPAHLGLETGHEHKLSAPAQSRCRMHRWKWLIRAWMMRRIVQMGLCLPTHSAGELLKPSTRRRN